MAKLLRISPVDRDGVADESRAVWMELPEGAHVTMTLAADPEPEWLLMCYQCPPPVAGQPGRVYFFATMHDPYRGAQDLALDWWERHGRDSGHTNMAVALLSALDADTAAGMRAAAAAQGVTPVPSPGGSRRS
jgi:hypothetical protein